MEPTIHIITVYLFEGLEYGLHFFVGEMVDSCKAYLPDEGEKERHIFDGKSVIC